MKRQVFFSYGHDCEEIVLKIKEDLEKYGFQIWVDRSEIKSGNEWRAKITSGILNSDVVVAFLSKYALRKSGVCLKELSIAVGCKYGHIKTVLLEPNIESMIPATISDIQYCDMTKWKKMKHQDEASFSRWYEEKFQEILEVLSGKETIEMENHLKYLEQMLSPAMWQIRQSRELKNNYIIRKNLEKSIFEWIQQKNSSRIFVIYGEPGTGKSTFLINYHHYNYEAVAIAFCDWKKQGLDKNKEILRSIAFQLAAKIPAYRTSLVWHLENRTTSLTELSEEELFTLLLTDPWRNCITETKQKYLILIDGMNGSSEKNGNVLAELLTTCGNELPQNIKFLITARKDLTITSYFSECSEYEIIPEAKENTKLIKEYYRLQLYNYLEKWEENETEHFLDILTEKSEGNFLYAELLAKGILDGKIFPKELSVIPHGLSGIYRQWFLQLFPDEDIYYDFFFIPICILCAVDDPIPIELLRKIMGWNVINYRKFLKLLKNFLRIQKNAFGKETITLFHSSMTKWLLSEEAGIFQVDSEEGLQTLKAQLKSLFEEQQITPYECKLLVSVVDKSNDKLLLEDIYSSEYFFEQYMCLAKAYESVRNGYHKAILIYTHLKEISMNFPSENKCFFQQNSLSYCLGRCFCQIGDYHLAKKVLEEKLENIDKILKPKDVMEIWYILGSVYDWFGQREESLKMFYKLKQIAENEKDVSFLLKAMIGLIWNEHFNHIEEAMVKLNQLSEHETLSKVDREMCELIKARILLSTGKLNEALQLYEKCLLEFDFSFVNDVRGYRKNRLLLIEILPGCYDNAQYEKGIETGKQILEKIKNTGWLEECYCISWISLNYLGMGDVETAWKYLKKAQYLLNSVEQTSRSQWITMHLCSVTALVLFEEGNYKDSSDMHRVTLEYALKCKDAWVAGDACFELLKIALFYDKSLECKIEYYYEILENLSKSSGLPHLKLKRELVQGLLGVREENHAKITDALDRLQQYPEEQNFSSTNKMEISCILCVLYQAVGNTKMYQREQKKIMRYIRQPEYRERPSVKRLITENGENLKEYANFSIEYCDPLIDEKANYWMKLEHLGRYLWAKKICDELDVARVADIACATGYGCSILAQEAEQVVGIDRSYQYLEKAPKIENVTYVCKNLDTMEADIYESFFDMIVCFETIEHVKYPERLIQSFSKMLNKNGTLLLSFPNSCYEKVDENGENADIYHLHVFQKEEVEKWLKMNGFEILNCLGQSYCNLRCQAEYDALKAGRIATEELEKEHECTLSELFQTANACAVPTIDDVEHSYSYILRCKKI